MWTAEHSIEATLEPEAVWQRWADVAGWPEWNADIEHVELQGPFAAGSMIFMTPRGQDAVALRIAVARDGEVFVDEAEVAGTVVCTTHRIDRLPADRVRV